MRQNEWIPIGKAKILYIVRHRIMEGDCQAEHGPVAIELDAYQIQRYPVTNARYMAFVLETGYRPANEENFLKQLASGLNRENEDLPVTYVSPEDAAAYAAHIGARLPTQAQWQYAAQGPKNYLWPWGDEFDASRLNGDSGALTPVDAFPRGQSAFGVMDLCGNAWEMTREIYDDSMHRFCLLRGGCHYRAEHFWHMAGGGHDNRSHEKMPLLAGGLNRAATVSFRCVKEEIK